MPKGAAFRARTGYRAALGLLERGGHIIDVTSEAVDASYPHHVCYQATKGGVILKVSRL